MQSFHLQRTQTHTVWDNSIPPAVEVAPGDELTVEVANASGGQLGPESTVEDVAKLDFSKVNPVTGPIAVAGAEPGDALVVDVIGIELQSWGWTASIPGFGLLADLFPDPHLRISDVTSKGAELLPGVFIPIAAMIGTIGVAMPEPGEHSVVPPSRYGGNMDIRHLGSGARLWLPVGAPGALLSLGDTHAAQGDGEICGTAIEASSQVTIHVNLERARALPGPQLLTDPVSTRPGPAFATTGIGPDLYVAARDATTAMLDELTTRTSLSDADAYLLVSCAGDLKVSEIVDQPNWVVTMHIERDLLAALV